jgi:hypothetical protein
MNITSGFVSGVFVALNVAVVACAGTSREDGVVAIANGREIVHRQIDCKSSFIEEVSECQKHEQGMLRIIMHERAIDAGARLFGITLNEAERSQIESLVAAQRVDTRRFADAAEALDMAVLRLLKGEDREKVELDLDRAGVDRRSLDPAMRRVKTIAEAEASVRTDRLQQAEEAHREFMHRHMLKKNLQHIVQKRAETSGRSFRMEEETLWREVLAQSDFRVIDNRYHMPEFGGILSEID